MRRDEPGEDIRIFDLLLALNRRKFLMVVVIAASVAAAVGYNRRAIPIYQANARLLLEPNTPEVVPFQVKTTSVDQSTLARSGSSP